MAGSFFRFRWWLLGLVARGGLLGLVLRGPFLLRLLGFWLAVHTVHADVDPLPDPQDDGLGGLGHRVRDGRPLARLEPAEHVVGGVEVLARRPDPDPQPGVVLGPQVLLGAPQALLATVGPLRPRPQLA